MESGRPDAVSLIVNRGSFIQNGSWLLARAWPIAQIGVLCVSPERGSIVPPKTRCCRLPYQCCGDVNECSGLRRSRVRSFSVVGRHAGSRHAWVDGRVDGWVVGML